jgi:hypothetical protein
MDRRLSARAGLRVSIALVGGAVFLGSAGSRPAAGADAITDIVMTPGSPAALQYYDSVDISFRYEIDEPEGAWITWTPYSGSEFILITPLVHYPAGTGSGVAHITATHGPVTVDQVQVQMYDSTGVETHFSLFTPTEYHYGQVGSLTDVAFDPPSPAALSVGDTVWVTFDYTTPQSRDIQITAVPYTGSDPAPGYAAGDGRIYLRGSGIGTEWFTLPGGPGSVDRVLMWTGNSAVQVTYIQFFIPVSFSFEGTTPVRPTTWGRLKAATRE